MQESKGKNIEKHLKRYGSITSWTAIMKYNHTRLSDVIFNLRKRGWDIETQMICKKGVRYAKYVLKGDKDDLV